MTEQGKFFLAVVTGVVLGLGIVVDAHGLVAFVVLGALLAIGMTCLGVLAHWPGRS